MTKAAHLKYRPDIDGLRAISVLFVVGFHTFPDFLRGGFVGVDVFFVISGFLISSIILKSLRNDTFGFWDFYKSRIRRIFPALLLVLAACYAIGWYILLADEFRELGKHIAGGAGFIDNLVLWQEAGYFDTAADAKPLLHLWSLGIEEQFYIVWPLVLVAAYKFRLNILYVAIAIFAASFGLNLYQVQLDPSGAFYSPATRFWELMAGCILAVLANELPSFDGKRGKTWSNVLCIAGLALIGGSFLVVHKDLPYPSYWALMPTVGAVMAILGGRDSWLGRNVLSHKWLVAVGLVSYPLYLWHWPLLSFARIIENERPIHAIRVVAVGISFVLAVLTYLVVEKRIKRGGFSLGRALATVGALIVVGGLGFDAYRREGLNFRSVQKRVPGVDGDLFENPNMTPAAETCLASVEPKAAVTKCASNTGAARIAVIGDSHAGHFYPGLVASNLPVKVLWNGGCPPMGVFDRAPSECIRNWEYLKAHIDQNKDSIKVVLLSTYYPFYLAKARFDGEKGRPFETLAQEIKASATDEAKVAQLFLEGMDKSVSYFEEKGMQVGLLLDPPELPYHPRKCFSFRPIKLRPNKPEGCAPTPRAEVEKRLAYSQRIALALKEKHPSLKIFDPTPHFCDDGYCYSVKNGRLLYWDDNHLNTHGSKLIAGWIEKWVQANFATALATQASLE